jgi:hypothetical protein
MNWLIVVVAGVFFICAVNWIVSGQYNFRGPKRGVNDFALPATSSTLFKEGIEVEFVE